MAGWQAGARHKAHWKNLMPSVRFRIRCCIRNTGLFLVRADTHAAPQTTAASGTCARQPESRLIRVRLSHSPLAVPHQSRVCQSVPAFARSRQPRSLPVVSVCSVWRVCGLHGPCMQFTLGKDRVVTVDRHQEVVQLALPPEKSALRALCCPCGFHRPALHAAGGAGAGLGWGWAMYQVDKAFFVPVEGQKDLYTSQPQPAPMRLA